MRIFKFPIANQIHDSKLVVTPRTMVIHASLKMSRTLWNCNRNRQFALLKRSAKNIDQHKCPYGYMHLRSILAFFEKNGPHEINKMIIESKLT